MAIELRLYSRPGRATLMTEDTNEYENDAARSQYEEWQREVDGQYAKVLAYVILGAVSLSLAVLGYINWSAS